MIATTASSSRGAAPGPRPFCCEPSNFLAACRSWRFSRPFPSLSNCLTSFLSCRIGPPGPPPGPRNPLPSGGGGNSSSVIRPSRFLSSFRSTAAAFLISSAEISPSRFVSNGSMNGGSRGGPSGRGNSRASRGGLRSVGCWACRSVVDMPEVFTMTMPSRVVRNCRILGASPKSGARGGRLGPRASQGTVFPLLVQHYCRRRADREQRASTMNTDVGLSFRRK